MYPFFFKNQDRRRMRRCLRSIDIGSRFSRLPGASLHPWMWPSKTDMRWLPINEDIEMAEDMPMPITILDQLIEEASHRMIYEFCGCREACQCNHYPREIGCLMLGDSAAGANPDFCREVDVAEAKEHARKAVDAGLVPFVGVAKVDETIFGIKGRGHLLSVCFCCECCCLTRFFGRFPLKSVENMMTPLDGIRLEINDNCNGCGTCVEKCYTKAIDIVNGRARKGAYCRYCGRCASVCPNDAIEISLTDPDYIDKTIERIRSYVKYG